MILEFSIFCFIILNYHETHCTCCMVQRLVQFNMQLSVLQFVTYLKPPLNMCLILVFPIAAPTLILYFPIFMKHPVPVALLEKLVKINLKLFFAVCYISCTCYQILILTL